MPPEVAHDMFERIKRVTPGPQRAFEAGLKPITSIFDEIQGWSGHERELPDCNQFVDELFNINMLTVDVYAPAQKPRRPRAGLQSDRDDPIFRQLDDEPNTPMRELITEKVIELCTAFLQSLRDSKMPFTVRVMLRTIVDRSKAPGASIESCTHIIADLLAACWLSNGFRWAECLGATPALKDAALL